MTNPVALLRNVQDGDERYEALLFWCPGCQHIDTEDQQPRGGLHLLPVNSPQTKPQWDWDRNLEKPTLHPSILTRGVQWGEDETFYRPNHSRVAKGGETICHSWLRGGVFEFLADSTHNLAGQHVVLPPLPDWALDE